MFSKVFPLVVLNGKEILRNIIDDPTGFCIESQRKAEREREREIWREREEN